MKDLDFRWTRCLQDETPIYFCTDAPNWFVPNRKGDDILRGIAAGRPINGRLEDVKFLSRIPRCQSDGYPGRSRFLRLETINELWFHLTNRCNMACGHCLFASSPADASELPASRILEIADEAYAAGCRLFALTGGEPLVHPQIGTVVDRLLAREGVHVAMLTNGLELVSFMERLEPDPDWFHLQISMDGMRRNHDRLRGSGAFDKLMQTLQWLKRRGFPYTIAMCVTGANVNEMPRIVDLAARNGAGNVHYMWHFVRGRGRESQSADNRTIFDHLVRSEALASEQGLFIDNLEAIKTQIFAPAGTIHDGSTAGWESLAVGPDARLYPSAALVGVDALATDMPSGLVDAWRRSPVLRQVREASVAGLASPLRYLLGGGDPDHSYLHSRNWLGGDPYEPLYEMTALWLIGRAADESRQPAEPGIVLQMGEILESCNAHGKVALVHSNCLLATTVGDSLTTVKTFYSEAAADAKPEILNPVCYDPPLISHIPEAYRFRGYGCGSPVLDAGIRDGEHVLDLGCGSGVECFIASRLTGRDGSVVGVDMLDPMLALARKAQPLVAGNLRYDNLDFRKGYLENLPVESETVDVVISNCVMNLSVNKRRAFGEILRVLRPGGRLVIADVVCEAEPDPAIRNDETLKGECIAGAMTASHLVALLQETGFDSVMLLKRFPYREVSGHPFFSLTYSAVKPVPENPVRVIYRGPLPFLAFQDGQLLVKGETVSVDRRLAETLGDQLFVLDARGSVLNVAAENTCACFTAPENRAVQQPVSPAAPAPPAVPKRQVGCMVCGAPLVYSRKPRQNRCAYCGAEVAANSACSRGHFVCDPCHSEDGVAVIRRICTHTDETDMVRIFEHIRRHPALPMHGPEYHALVPGVILTAYRNLSGTIDESLIRAGIDRGRSIAGGFCGFMGVCGAAVGVGIAFSLLIDANPTKPAERRIVQQVTQQVLGEISRLKAARCCHRDSWIALSKAAELSATFLPIALKAEFRPVCGQHHRNGECIKSACPLFPESRNIKY